MSSPLQLRRRRLPHLRYCELPWKECPDLGTIENAFDQVTTLDWTLPERGNPVWSRLNVCMRQTDEFINAFEESRQNNDLEQFQKTRMRREFTSQNLSLEEFNTVMATLAQMRAIVINYLLARRVSPVLHQEAIDNQIAASPTYIQFDKGELARQRVTRAWTLVGHFWGTASSGEPLVAGLIGSHSSVTEFAGWADPVNDKLAALAKRLRTDAKKVRDLF
ncbi:hypothetical protein GGR54DRAFT_271855 [Hypoxylon sp. NC1633]|nr:hypothetical protein GGR54DRAFT_271855 [Hypoxylon sp. NC1633]